MTPREIIRMRERPVWLLRAFVLIVWGLVSAGLLQSLDLRARLLLEIAFIVCLACYLMLLIWSWVAGSCPRCARYIPNMRSTRCCPCCGTDLDKDMDDQEGNHMAHVKFH